MNTARKIENQNFRLIKGRKSTYKRLDRLFAAILVLIGFSATLVDGNVALLIITLFISTPLVFSKKRFVQL